MPDAPTPLDLDAIRARLTMNRLGTVAARETDRDLVAIRALLDEVERLRDACKTLGGIIDQQCIDIAKITHSEHLVAENGDADWGAIWDRGFELADRAEKAEAEVARLTAHPAPTWDEEAATEALARALFQRMYPGSAAWDNLPVDEFGKEVWRESAKGLLAVVREHLPVKPSREALIEAMLGSDIITDDLRAEASAQGSTQREPFLCFADAVLDLWPGESRATVQVEALRDAADEYEARLPDGTGNGRAYNSYTVAAMLRARADRLAAEGGADRG